MVGLRPRQRLAKARAYWEGSVNLIERVMMCSKGGRGASHSVGLTSEVGTG